MNCERLETGHCCKNLGRDPNDLLDESIVKFHSRYQQ